MLRPDVVVSGEMGPRSLQAASYCCLTKTPFIVWSEGTPHTERGILKLKIWVRKLLVSRTYPLLVKRQGNDSAIAVLWGGSHQN